MIPTEEQIAALADGELAGEEARAVAAAVARDPALSAKVAAHRAVRGRLSAYFAPVAEQPVPAHLAELLVPKSTDNVASFAQARQQRGLPPQVRRFAPFGLTALAASLALVVVWPKGGAEATYADTRLAQALDTQLSGEAGRERVLLSFEDADGEFCRVWSGEAASGIACRDATGWRIERSARGSGAQGGQYRQAGSGESDLLAAAQAMAPDGALDAEQEARARRKRWRK